MTSARDEVLSRIRAVTCATVEVPKAERLIRRQGLLDLPSRLDLFEQRVTDYQAMFVRTNRMTVARELTRVCRHCKAECVGIPPALPTKWRPHGITLVEDHNLVATQLDALDGVITGCSAAIAETGTLILTSGACEGRRALTLVPDLHVCIVLEEQVHELVPEAIEAIEKAGHSRRPITLISGPSATSDIELSRVEGVHGPRQLVVVLVSTSQSPAG